MPVNKHLYNLEYENYVFFLLKLNSKDSIKTNWTYRVANASTTVGFTLRLRVRGCMFFPSHIFHWFQGFFSFFFFFVAFLLVHFMQMHTNKKTTTQKQTKKTNPSIFGHCFSYNGVPEGCQVHPSSLRAEAGLHLGQVSLPQWDQQSHSHQPGLLMCMSLHCGRKPECLDRTHTVTGWTCKLHAGPGIKPPRALWGDRHTCSQSPRTRMHCVASSLTEFNSSVHHIFYVVRRYVVLTAPETCKSAGTGSTARTRCNQ